MYNSFLIKYGEIGIKGDNRHLFEDALAKRIRTLLARIDGDFDVTKTRGRIYVNCGGNWNFDETIDVLQHVFGIVGICPVVIYEKGDIEKLRADIVSYISEEHPGCTSTFKVKARRVDKEYPLTSMEVDAELGEAILMAYPSMKVMLLLSGGIDSPVAGWMIAKRGVTLDATYFHAPPYTSERAKQKVVDLAKQIAAYAGPIRLHIVNFTDIQLAIYDRCPHNELTIIMRRYMMKIAEHFAKEDGDLGLVTGESIGQVASQTMQSLFCTDAACTMPVYRPLIGSDKNDISAIARKIGTYETSILPYEDCCTIFVAKHPVTKPILSVIEKSEQKLKSDIDELVRTAIEQTETIIAK